MHGSLSALVAELARGEHFEEAATHTLRRMLDVAQEAVASSRYAGKARLLRGLVHLRPGDADVGRERLRPEAAGVARHRPEVRVFAPGL